MSRHRQHQLIMQSPVSTWVNGWQLHVDCWGRDCAKGRYRYMEDLALRHGADTLARLVQRVVCRGCGGQPTMIWLYRPALRDRASERVPLVGGVA